LVLSQGHGTKADPQRRDTAMTEQITPDITSEQLTITDDREIHDAARRIIADTKRAGEDALDGLVTDWQTTITRQTAVTIPFNDENQTVYVTVIETPNALPTITAAAIQVEHNNDVLIVSLPLDHPLAGLAAELAFVERPQR
jgi:hypothetical protein